MSKVIDFFRDIFVPGKTYKMDATFEEEKDVYTLRTTEFAVRSCAGLIADLMSKCEFKTYYGKISMKGDDWYAWNVQPNYNQSAPEFKAQLVRTILTKGEALVVQLGDGLHIAESFEISDSALTPAYFRNVTIMRPDGATYDLNRAFQMSEVCFFRLQDKRILALLRGVEDGYEKISEMAVSKYKRSAGKHGIVKANRTAAGDEEAKKKQNEVIKQSFKKYFSEENGLAVLPNGIDYTEQPQVDTKVNEVSNLTSLQKMIYQTVGQVYHVPVGLLYGDVIDTSKAISQILTFMIDPLANMIQTVISRSYFGPAILAGTHFKVDTTSLLHVDVFEIATAADKLIADGLYSIDELRGRIGDEALGTSWSGRHYMTKNYTGIENIDSASGKGE